MIRAILTAIILITGIAGAQQKERPPTDWKPVIGVEIEGAKFYIDAKSQITIKLENNREFNSADLMVSYDKPTKAITLSKEIIIRSKVHKILIDCETGIAAPVSDLYFTEPMPNRSSKPIAGDKYPTNPMFTRFQVDKTSILYNILCPIYI